MVTQLDMVALSFVDIEYFVRSCPAEKAFAGPSFQVINKFLNANREILCDLLYFNESGIEESRKEPKIVNSINLRGTIYNKINKESCQEAFYLANFLDVREEECLRIVNQTKNKTQQEVSSVKLAKCVLKERNASLQTLLLLFSDDGSNALSKELIDYVLGRRLEICQNAIATLKRLLASFNKDPDSSCDNFSKRDDDEIVQLRNTQNLIYLNNLLRLVTLLILNVNLPVILVKEWFSLIGEPKNNFTSISNASFSLPILVTKRIESLITVNTLLMLGLNSTIATLDLEAPYYNDAECFKEIHEILLNQNINPVILYMWSFILFAKSFSLEEEPDKEIDFVRKVFGKTPISESIARFATKAEKLNVFEHISTMAESLSEEKFYSVIIASYLSFALHFIPLNVETSKVIKVVLGATPEEFIEQFLTTPEFEKKLAILKAKLPLVDEALLPLMNISTVHTEFANFEWKNLHTYTCKQKLGELDYDIVDDKMTSPDMDLIVLKKESFARPSFEFDQAVWMPIPAETKGKILPVSSNNEEVIAFMYKYNGWAVLGRILENICNHYVVSGNDLEGSSKDIIIAIIDLISNIVSPRTPIERSTEILQYLSTNVYDEDVISVILKIFEHSLHKRDYDIITVCSNFLALLFPNFQHLVWTYLARSDLLDKYGKTGLATSTLGSIELPFGEYSFTISLIMLADDIVTESFSMENEFPSKTKMDLLDRIISYLIDISESYQYWKYNNVTQRFQIGLLLNTLFTKILYNVYGIDPSSPPSQKVSSLLSGCSQKILNAFLTPQSPDVPAVNSLLNSILSLENIQISLLGDSSFGNIFTKLIKCSFELATLLISIRGLLKLKPSSLERLIYSKSPFLVDIYCYYPSLKGYVIRLFHSLVRVPWTDDYLFLLSYLGTEHSGLFLNAISSDLESTLDNHRLSKDLYQFFSALMESKQDGLSILFLTGNVVSSTNQDAAEISSNRKSILTILKKNALKLDLLPESVGCCLLDSISYAFNTWANARDSKSDKEFILALLKRIKEFKSPNVANEEEMIVAAGKYKLISCIIEIIALYLFTSAEVDPSIMELLNKGNLVEFLQPFFEISGYHKQLHEQLHKKFEDKWPKLKLSRFNSSPLYHLDIFSLDSIFSISLMDQYFGDDEKWIGSDVEEGYRTQVLEASINLKYVNCQIAAAKAWGALLTTFIRKTNNLLDNPFLELASNLVKLNIDSGVEASIFTDVYRERLEICFYILFAFHKNCKPIAESMLFELVGQLLTVFKSPEVDFSSNIAYSNKRNYYRPVIRSVLLVLSFVTSGTHFLELQTDQLLEFFEISFCKGVQLIASEILSDISSSNSSGKRVVIYNMGERIQDLFLLLSLFTKLRSLKPTDTFNAIIASSLNETGTLKVILNLYSSSHIFKVNEEAVLAPLILSFVSELCTIDRIASKLINSGLFTTLLESPLSIAIQAGGVEPERQGSLHNIWTNGLLSIVLLLLSKFGRKVLPECCLFISYFTKQVETAINRWSDGKLAVSTSLIRETTQLVMLQKMMENLGYKQYLSNTERTVSTDDESVELIVGLDTQEEKNSLSVALNRLLTHPKYLNSRIVPTTLEEQRLLENENTRVDFVKELSKKIKELQLSLFCEE